MTDQKYTITLDDDPLIARIIEKMTTLTNLPFVSAERLLSRAKEYHPVAAFIDVHLEENSCGIDIVPKLRLLWPFTAIFVITADVAEDILGQALAAGANDFLRKPLKEAEFIPRFRIRTAEMVEKAKIDVMKIGDFVFNHQARYVESGGAKIFLSPGDATLLRLLAESKGVAVSRKEVKRKIWGSIAISENTLDRKISDLRKILKDISKTVSVQSVYGKGVLLKDIATS